jgi:hypothetical protein
LSVAYVIAKKKKEEEEIVKKISSKLEFVSNPKKKTD